MTKIRKEFISNPDFDPSKVLKYFISFKYQNKYFTLVFLF